MRRRAQMADRNVMATQRAFVYVSELTWSGAAATSGSAPIWANSGTTPTRSFGSAPTGRRRTASCRPTSTINYVACRRRTCSSARRAKAEFGAIFIPMRDIQAAIEERLHLYVWGRATYDDMFEGTSRISSSSAIA